MNRDQQNGIVIGILLLLAGFWFLAVQFFPGLARLFQLENTWPLLIVAGGGLMLVIGLLTRNPDMAIPATIIGGIGTLLYWQNATGNWESWAYAWALIPGFVGTGMLLARLLGSRQQQFREGFGLIVTSLVMFTIFSAFFGGWNFMGRLWPLMLILLGAWLLVRPMLDRRRL